MLLPKLFWPIYYRPERCAEVTTTDSGPQHQSGSRGQTLLESISNSSTSQAETTPPDQDGIPRRRKPPGIRWMKYTHDKQLIEWDPYAEEGEEKAQQAPLSPQQPFPDASVPYERKPSLSYDLLRRFLQKLPAHVLSHVLLFGLSGALFITTAVYSVKSHERTSSSCTLSANPDISGLGVRATAYIQIAGTILPSRHTGSDTVALLGAINFWYLLSASTTLVTGTGQADFSLYDGYVLLTLANGILLSSLPGLIWFEDFQRLWEPFWSTGWKNLLITCWGAVSMFFWWNFSPGFSPEDAEGACTDALGWFFAPINLTKLLSGPHRAIGALQLVVTLLVAAPFWVAFLSMVITLWGNQMSWSNHSLRHIRAKTRWSRVLQYFRSKTGAIYDITFGSRNVYDLVGSNPSARPSFYTDPLGYLFRDFQIVGERYMYDFEDYLVSYEASDHIEIQHPRRNPHTFPLVWGGPRGTALSTLELGKRLGVTGFQFRYFWHLNVLLYVMCSVEISLILNAVEDMHSLRSPGQMSAFIMGLSGMVPLLGLTAYVSPNKGLKSDLDNETATSSGYGSLSTIPEESRFLTSGRDTAGASGPTTDGQTTGSNVGDSTGDNVAGPSPEGVRLRATRHAEEDEDDDEDDDVPWVLSKARRAILEFERTRELVD